VGNENKCNKIMKKDDDNNNNNNNYNKSLDGDESHNPA